MTEVKNGKRVFHTGSTIWADLREACVHDFPTQFFDASFLEHCRPDIVALKDNILYLIELTVPHARNVEISHQGKVDKYTGLTDLLKKHNAEKLREVRLLCVEVTSVGIPGKSISALTALTQGEDYLEMISACTRAAVHGSMKIYNNRDSDGWRPKVSEGDEPFARVAALQQLAQRR